MPTKNRVKTYVPEAYYHVYNRGVNKRRIFLDDQDYSVFLSLLKRYLSDEDGPNKYNITYENLSSEVEVLAYCLMPNHVHLLIYQISPEGMTNLMRRVFTAYSMYFNKKYKRVGGLFQDAYKASHIDSDEYLQHISRYIHLNPTEWTTWDFSSLDNYRGRKVTSWLNQQRILELFRSGEEYLSFLADYDGYKKSLDEIKHQLADH
jgi:putative transposase